ncbi:hypothetical protein Adt_46896 [Abeliophyllum distichum]|uniref:Uncharacterized protein n=1 Tax=Abeliophyllum distichum TaxID=126358 RepID=A0ABD1NX98_9LAMI
MTFGVCEYRVEAKNARDRISDWQAIGHLPDRLAPCKKRIVKIIQEEMLVQIPLGDPNDIVFLDFCNALNDYWKTYLGEVISHSGYKSAMTSDDEVTQLMKTNEKEKEDRDE